VSELEPRDNEKEQFFREFESIRPDLIYADGMYDGVPLSDEQKRAVSDVVRPTRVKTGMLASIPMRCEGSKCPFYQSCPLAAKGIEPVGEKCPIEMAAVQQFFYDYVEELQVDVNRMVEVSMVRDLVDQEIQQLRKTWLLSQEHFIQENVVGIDENGNVITKKELHQAVDYEDKILKRKEKLRNALLATRESKAKIGQGEVDSASVVSNLLHEIRKVDQLREKELKARLGMEEYDEYIEADIEEETLLDEED